MVSSSCEGKRGGSQRVDVAERGRTVQGVGELTSEEVSSEEQPACGRAEDQAGGGVGYKAGERVTGHGIESPSVTSPGHGPGQVVVIPPTIYGEDAARSGAVRDIVILPSGDGQEPEAERRKRAGTAREAGGTVGSATDADWMIGSRECGRGYIDSGLVVTGRPPKELGEKLGAGIESLSYSLGLSRPTR